MTNPFEPKVSVVMPTFNRADLLARSAGAILSQDYDDLELLIVDDGSTDNTAAVVREIQLQDARLRYLQLGHNHGIGYARQAGLEHVFGRYVALADSDDLWLPGKLKGQIAVMEQHPDIDILFGDWLNLDHINGTRGSGFLENRAGLNYLAVRSLSHELRLVEGGLEAGILRSNFIQPATMLVRARVFQQVGGFEPVLRTMPDHEFAWRAALRGAQFAYLNRMLIERHRYPSSVTARAGSSLELLEALEICQHQAAGMPHRPALAGHIRAARHRSWRNIIRTYGENGKRGQVLRAYWQSLQHGFSARTFGFFALGLGGPWATALTMRLRKAWAERDSSRVGSVASFK